VNKHYYSPSKHGIEIAVVSLNHESMRATTIRTLHFPTLESMVEYFNRAPLFMIAESPVRTVHEICAALDEIDPQIHVINTAHDNYVMWVDRLEYTGAHSARTYDTSKAGARGMRRAHRGIWK
jgi:hypothetical protein